MSSPYSQPAPKIAIPSGPPPQGWYGPSEGPSPAGSSSRPPSQGWYGPSRSLPTTPLEQPISQPASPQRQTPGSQYRSLHSERYQRGLQHANAPDAFQPTSAGYGPPQFPMGPPTILPSTQVNASRSAWPQPQPQTQWRQTSPVPTYRPQVQRQDSAGSTGYPFPRQQPPSPAPASTTPVSFAPPPGPPPGRRPVQHQRMSSLDEELMAHTPAAGLYPAQQPASMPDQQRHGLESPQPSRVLSWSQSPPPPSAMAQPQPYTLPSGPPPGAVGAVRRPSRGAGSPMVENYFPMSYPPEPVPQPGLEPEPEPMGYYTPDQLVRARMLAHEQQQPQSQPQGWGGGGWQSVRSGGETRPGYGAGGQQGSAEYFPSASSSSAAPMGPSYYPPYQVPGMQEQQAYASAPGHFAPQQQVGYGPSAQQGRYYAQL
ncbi:hypothetical protein KC353_g14380 [Hortaea werneckii]|nr:hypothetical protein KC353_g14380 [Hortaea werneckii]